MPRLAKPFTTPRRTDSKTFQITLNPACGLHQRVCAEWYRRSFHDFPDDLANHRNPKICDEPFLPYNTPLTIFAISCSL